MRYFRPRESYFGLNAFGLWYSVFGRKEPQTSDLTRNLIPETSEGISDFGEVILVLEQGSCGSHIIALEGRMELKFCRVVDLSRTHMLANFQPQSLNLKLLKKLAAEI